MEALVINFAVVIAFLTVIFGILAKVVGFPDQIRKNYKRKSTEGLSTIFIAIAVVSYVLWTLHGLLINDWVLVVGQGLGIITTGIIALQIIHYKKRSTKKKA
ncbi:MAG TPA: PQ-loop repeat-containing protein [archaeon]|nr:PQ-loop repeat-containing protein [archaeon]